MANQLITVDEAARDLSETIVKIIEDARAEGVPDAEIAQGIEDFFARMGGFPERAEPA
jgi:hypothetical protein